MSESAIRAWLVDLDGTVRGSFPGHYDTVEEGYLDQYGMCAKMCEFSCDPACQYH